MSLDKTKSSNRSPYQVQVLDRALAILQMLSADGPDLSLGELSTKLELHKSTVHRLIMVLERHKLVERNSDNGRYRLGLKLFEFGTKAVAKLDLRGRARPVLERLVLETSETVHLCILDDTEVVYLDKVEPARSVRMASSVGRRNPAYCTAVGKAILAWLPEAQVESIVRKHGLKAITSNTITSFLELKTEMTAIRDRGYAIDDEEIEEGVRCVGCVVRDFSGGPVAAISVSGPAFRLTREKLKSIARPVVAASNSLSAELGFKQSKIASASNNLAPATIGA
ncbi:MAG TPA: IclR family transcriptional regulator [Candidatus Angelobacter sp.]|nr:IclR family transcriptional regulator [Candidatus Angelobacter sp.]